MCSNVLLSEFKFDRNDFDFFLRLTLFKGSTKKLSNRAYEYFRPPTHTHKIKERKIT